MAYDFKIMSTFFHKSEEHLMTYKSQSSRSHIFYFIRSADKRVYKDYKMILT